MVRDRSDGDADSDQSSEQVEGELSVFWPKEMALMALMKKTGYNMVQVNGQRKYGGPPPGWEGPPPPRGCEVFVGKIPRDMYEDELVPLFEHAGRIYEFRLMMEFSGENRGYAFIMYTNRDSAQKAIQMLDKHEIRPGKFIGVCVSLDNCRLFIGSIPKDKKKDEIMEEMKKVTEGVVDVIVYLSSTDKTKNRGFAFVEYESHKAAAMARRKLIPNRFELWGHSIQVDWAEPEKDMDEEVMQRVRVLYVRNLMLSTSEETLQQEFSRFKPGSVERVKKITDYAFVHYCHRDDALTALGLMNGAEIDGAAVEVSLAKPANVNREGGANSAGGVAKKYHNRGYLGNDNHSNLVSGAMATAAGGGAGAGGGAEFMMHRNNNRDRPMRDLSSRLGELYFDHTDGVEQGMYPLFPGMPLSPTSLLSLKQSQICTAQSLLEYFCRKNYWPPPEYHLYSTPGHNGKLLLLYKVVLLSTRSTYIPDKLCVLLDDAKELAAQTTLWNLAMRDSSSSTALQTPPPVSSPVLACERPVTPCVPLPPPFPLSPMAPPPALPPSQSQGLYLSPPLPFY